MTTADKRKQQHHHSWSEMFHRKSRFKEAAGRSDPNGHPETQRPESEWQISTCLNTDADLSWSWLWQRSLHETQHTRTRNFNGCVCRAHIRYAHIAISVPSVVSMQIPSLVRRSCHRRRSDSHR